MPLMTLCPHALSSGFQLSSWNATLSSTDQTNTGDNGKLIFDKARIIACSTFGSRGYRCLSYRSLVRCLWECGFVRSTMQIFLTSNSSESLTGHADSRSPWDRFSATTGSTSGLCFPGNFFHQLLPSPSISSFHLLLPSPPSISSFHLLLPSPPSISSFHLLLPSPPSCHYLSPILQFNFSIHQQQFRPLTPSVTST